MILVWPSLPRPFLVAKVAVFHASALMAALMALAYCIVAWRPVPIQVWLMGLFVAIMGLADAHGIAPARSFGGEPIWMDGFAAPFYAGLYFFAVCILFIDGMAWRWLVRWWALSGLTAAGSGVMQIVYLNESHDHVTRIWGVMGQPVYLGIYLVFGAVFSLWAARFSKSKVATAAWILCAAVQIGVMSFTASRAAMGAGAICLAILAFCVFRKARWAHGVLGVVAVAGCIAAWPAVHAVLSDYDTMAYRMQCWHAELTFASLRPFLGWGQENMMVLCGPETPDRAHNFVVQLLLWGGAAALISYLVFLYSVLRRTIPVRTSIAVFSLVGIVAYVFTMSFEPETLTTTAAFLTFAGAGVSWKEGVA